MGSLCSKQKVVVKRAPENDGKSKPKVLKFKVCLVGTYDVGKSSIVVRFIKGTFTEGEVLTDGAAQTKRMSVEGQEIEIALHDTAGQEHYQNVTAGFYDQADALLFVYSIAAHDTFDDLKDWLKEATEAAERGKNKPLRFLLGNKFDLAGQRKVSIADAEKFAKQNDMQFFEVSAKTSDGLDRVLPQLSELLLQQAKES